MNIDSALKKAINILKNARNISPAVDAGVILCFVLNCEKTYLFTHYDYKLNSKEMETYFNLIDIRSKGVPIQYITGQKEFMSLSFTVNPNVLIPRPETEILVESVINHIKNYTPENDISRDHIDENYIPKDYILKNYNNNLTNKGEWFDILDIGTGSGCIAISLAYYIKNCHVTAVDISEEALDTARLNASSNGVTDKITFITGNLFEKLNGMTFDIIVSNPPYISTYEIRGLQTEVKDYEPIIALDGGKDGLDYYKRIIEKAPYFLNASGLLAFEVGYNQAHQVAGIMERQFGKIEIIKDLARINRVVMGCVVKTR